MAIMVFTPPAARALELVGGNINSTAPGTSFNSGTFSQPLPWDNVGQVSYDSATYLGDIGGNGEYWVLTPYHVAQSLPATATFDGIAYNTVAGSYVRLKNPDNSDADLAIFRLDINSNPAGLVTLTLESTTPSVGTDLYYVGYGGGSNTTKRWGYNMVAGYAYGNDTFGNIATFYSNYNTSSSNPNEAQAIGGDSGGAAFTYNSSTQSWELAGVMVAVDPNVNTYSLDMETYSQQIYGVVPEPGSVNLLLGGMAILGIFQGMRKCIRAKRAGAR